MRNKILILGAVLIPLIAFAGTIKVWSSGETLRANDLNSNFSHIHNLMVGGHGARLVDADVAANAQIATSKVVGLSDAVDAGVQLTPIIPRVPRIVLKFSTAGAVCSGSPCTLTYVAPASAVTSVTRSSGGVYVVTWATARADANYVVLVNGSTVAPITFCKTLNYTTASVQVNCYDTGGTGTDDVVSLIMIDDA